MSVGSVLHRLLEAPGRFGFDAALRVLMAARHTADPGRAATFRTPPHLGYPTAEVMEVRSDVERGAPEVVVSVIGLSSPSGVLPRTYTETAARALRDRLPAMHAFLDLLGSRLVAKFAAARIKYRLNRTDELERTAVRSEPLPSPMLALSGFALSGMTARMPTGPDPLIAYAGYLAMFPRSADRLAALLSDWLGRPVEIVELVGNWLPVPAGERTRLPLGHETGAWCQLGVDAAVGVRTWDQQARFVVRLRALDQAGFDALLPGRPALQRTVSLVRAFAGAAAEFSVNPVLPRAEVPELRLSADAETPACLGWNTWLPAGGLSEGETGEAADAIFDASAAEYPAPIAIPVAPMMPAVDLESTQWLTAQ